MRGLGGALGVERIGPAQHRRRHRSGLVWWVVAVFGAGNGAYLLSVTSSATRVCTAGVPLTYTPVTTVRVPVGQSANLASWSVSGATPYTLSVSAGVLSSSKTTIY